MAGLGDIPLPSHSKTEGEKLCSPSLIPLPPATGVQGDIKDPKFVPPAETTKTIEPAPEKTSKSKPIILVRNRFESYKKQVVKKKNETGKKDEKDKESTDQSKVVDDLFKEFMDQKLSDAEKTHRANIISRLQKKQAEVKSKEKMVEAEMEKVAKKYKGESTTNEHVVVTASKRATESKVISQKIIAEAKACKVPSVLENIKMSYDDDDDDDDVDGDNDLDAKKSEKIKHKKHKKHKHKDKHKSKNKKEKNSEKDDVINISKTVSGESERKIESQSCDIKITVRSDKEDDSERKVTAKSETKTVQIIPRSVQERAKKERCQSATKDNVSGERNKDDSNSSDNKADEIPARLSVEDDGNKDVLKSQKAVMSLGVLKEDDDRVVEGNKVVLKDQKAAISLRGLKEEEDRVVGGNKPVLKSQKTSISLGGLKISASSSSLISSGTHIENDPQKKNLEDGELTPELSESSSSSESEINEDDSDSGEITDNEDEKSRKKKKKKKKTKKKKKKHKKESKKKKSRSLSPKTSKRSHTKSRSRSPKRRRGRSRSPSVTFDKKLGVWVGRSRSRSRSRSRDKQTYRESRSRRDSSRDRNRSRSKERYYDRSRKDYRDYYRSKGRDRSRSRHRSRDRSHHHSRDRSRHRSRERSRHRSQERSKSKDRSRSREEKEETKKDRSKSRSPPKAGDYIPTWSDRARDKKQHKLDKEKEKHKHERDYLYRRSRSKTPEDLRLKIDKAKLRQIAIKNAVYNMKSGGPPVTLRPVDMAAMKSGGKSVEELTDYCKRIADKDGGGVSSSEEEGETKSDGETEVFSHPFQLPSIRDMQSNIVMNIRNSKALPLLTPTEKAQKAGALRTQFPVSSGSTHRANEGEWVEVEKTPPVTTTASKKPAAPPPPKTTNNAYMNTLAIMPAPPPPPEPTPAPPVEVKQESSVFPEAQVKNVDIGSLVSQRLSFMRQLNVNPNDSQAISQLYQVNKEMDSWARSKEIPGQYYGSTGAKVLSQEELGAGYQAWAKKDQFQRATAVKSGIGMMLLQKMGWRQGQGLGKDNEGKLEPLALDVKMDRKGLQSEGENLKKAPQARMAKNMSHKHPVSALTELCIKKKWGHPNFILVHESGPDHKKNFLFKATVNNLSYQPSIASNNKKQAKAQAAQVALQELGLLPRDMAPF